MAFVLFLLFWISSLFDFFSFFPLPSSLSHSLKLNFSFPFFSHTKRSVFEFSLLAPNLLSICRHLCSLRTLFSFFGFIPLFQTKNRFKSLSSKPEVFNLPILSSSSSSSPWSSPGMCSANLNEKCKRSLCRVQVCWIFPSHAGDASCSCLALSFRVYSADFCL